MTLTNRILLGMILGVIAGILLNLIITVDPDTGQPATTWGAWINTVLVNGFMDAIGQIFIKSLTLLVVPLVFVSLVCGSAALGGHSRMGAMAFKTVSLYLLTTAMAMALAILVAALSRAGGGVGLSTEASVAAIEPPGLKETFVNIFPSNPIQAMAEGNMLQVIVFSLLLGIALSRTESPISQNLQTFFNDLNTVVIKMVLLLMYIAPYGVFCLLVKLSSSLGFDALADLALCLFTVLLVLVLRGLGVFGALLMVLSGLNPLMFFRKMSSVMVSGFSTASS